MPLHADVVGMVCSRAWVSSLVLVAGVSLAASPASAQIFVSRDAAGTIVLSDSPMAGTTATYAVRGSSIRTTRVESAGTQSLYDEVIEAASAEHGVRPELVRAVIQVESAFNPRARSHVGAMGLMQLMPGTAADLGVDNPWDPVQNIHGGVAYLGSLIRTFGGDEVLALAAYNAGPGAVNRYGQKVPPYRETQDYVRKITNRTTVGSAPRGGSGRAIVYKVLEDVDGQLQWRLTGTRPTSGRYEVVR